MDSSGYTLLIIIALSLIALICVLAKQKALEKSTTVKAKEPSSITTKSHTAGTTIEPEKTSSPPQHTIYAFHVITQTRICPFCDGENSVGTTVCKICGKSM